MPACPAGNDDDAFDILYFSLAHQQLREQHLIISHPLINGLFNGNLLLSYLLKHEMWIPLLLCLLGIPCDGVHLFLYLLPIKGEERHALSRQLCHLAILKVHHSVGMLKDCRNVGCYELLPIPNADNKRAFVSCGNDSVRNIPADNAKGVASFNLPDSAKHSFSQVAFIGVPDEMGDN